MISFCWFALLSSLIGSTFGHAPFEQFLWPRVASHLHLVIEAPTNETLLNLLPSLAKRFSDLPSNDFHFQHFVPRFDSNATQETPYGVLEFDELINVGNDHVMFRVAGFPRLVVRYMHDCVGGPLPLSPHPLAKEYWLQQEAGLANVTRQWLFLSPPEAIPIAKISPLVGFNMTEAEFAACHFSGGTVRYMIYRLQDEIPLSRIGFAPPGPLTLSRFKFAMMLGAHLMSSLERLHARGIAHGSLSISTITFLQNDTINSISLNDYFFATTPDKPFPSFGAILPAISGSPWEIDSAYTFKDDIFRAIQVVAALINPREYCDSQARMTLADLQAWKLGGEIFAAPGAMYSPVATLPLPEIIKRRISARLSTILFLARDCVGQYRRIMANLRDIYILAFQQSRNRRKRSRSS